VSKTLPLKKGWRGMGPDAPRDAMPDASVWRMEDYIPNLLGSTLEMRQGWQNYVNSPLDGYVTAQQWVNTLGGNHHLAATNKTLYNLDNPAVPRLISTVGTGPTSGALWPMAALYEYVLLPRTGDQLPVVLRYQGQNEVLVTTHASTPKGKVAATWQSRFVLANTPTNPNFVYFLSAEWGAGLTTTPVWDPIAYWETTADVMGLAVTRNSLLLFHEGTVERLRGTKPPGALIEPDLWMEPLIGLGGCNEPHTICYWTDNVIFADARGVYITDGTTIKDITDQGGIGREWRKAYDPTWRVSAGVVYDQYVIAMTDVVNQVFKKCFVCDLYSKSWQIFNNLPFSSFVASIGEVERLFGGGLDGKVADLSTMWTEADATTNNVDGNGAAVLPQLETAWYRMSENESMKRVKNIYLSLDLDEVDGEVKVYVCEQVQPRSPADWILVKTITEGDFLDNRGQSMSIDGYRRRRILVGRESFGFAFKIETTGLLKNLKIYDLSAELAPQREDSYSRLVSQ
jgi:hypothetical protein